MGKVDSYAIARIITSQWNMILENCNTYEIRHLDAIRKCRTPALGGHEYQCDTCDHHHVRYHSCRNRHCPQCQNSDKKKWIIAREKDLIDTKYYHLVFTLPAVLNDLCLGYKREMYALLFRCSWETLNEFGWNKKYLGAQMGATMVLHTFGSNLAFHPHIHCIVPGGGITFSNKWKDAKGKGKFLFPVKALSKVFRGKFVDGLKKLMTAKGMTYSAVLNQQLYANKWVLYCKPPFGGAKGVIKYLARYTFKTAITHHRIISYDKDKVTFHYKDYRHSNQQKVMTLGTWEFIRRFCLHILPKGFTRIRHYGILSSKFKKELIVTSQTYSNPTWQEVWLSVGLDVNQCPNCKKGKLICTNELAPNRGPPTYPIPTEKPKNKALLSM